MGNWSARQLAAIGAVAAAVLFIVGFVLPGTMPKFNADPAKIISFFATKHKKVLVSTVLVEVAVAVLIGVIAQLAMLLRDTGHRGHAAMVGIAGAASVGAFGVGYGLVGGLGQIATFGGIPIPENAAVPPLYRLIQFIQVAWFWTTLVMVLAVALAAWQGAFPKWVAGANGIIAVLLALGGLSVRGRGAFAAGTGALPKLAGFAFLVWVIHLAWLFWSRPQEPPAAAAMRAAA